MIKRQILFLLLLVGVLKTDAQVHYVDPFTGTGSVSIPLFDYSIDGLSLGVSMSYSCTGIKVDQSASNVGLGWNLNAVGSITREKRNIEDDETGCTSPEQMESHGFWGVDWEFDDPILDRTEFQPDIFTASFGGRTLKFIIKPSLPPAAQSMEVYTYPKSNVKIEILYLNNVMNWYLPDTLTNESFHDAGNGLGFIDSSISFRITDESGNVFEFAPGDYSKHYTCYYDVYAIQKWILKKITTFTGSVITYEYDKFDANNFIDGVYPFVQESKLNGLGNPFVTTNVIDSPSYYRGKVYQIKRIFYPNGTTVTFNKAQFRPDGALDTVIITGLDIDHAYGGSSVIDRTRYSFDYALFNTPIADTSVPNVYETNEIPYLDNYAHIYALTNAGLSAPEAADHMRLGTRLKLRKIQRATNSGTLKDYFYFDYNTTPLPYRFSAKKDWYGYYNNKTVYPLTFGGNTYTNLSIPYHEITDDNNSTYSYGVDKASVIDYMKACVLTKVTNELGGQVEFVYKAHAVSFSTAGVVGTDIEGTDGYDGLCIDEVIERDGYNVDHTKVTKYTYSGGKKFNVGLHYWVANKFDNNDVPSVNAGTTHPLITTTYLDTTNVIGRAYLGWLATPLNYAKGATQGYSTVQVEQKGYNNELLNKTVYEFTNVDDAGSNYAYENKVAPYSHEYYTQRFRSEDIGLVKEEKTYGNSSSIIAKKIITYTTRTSTQDTLVSHQYNSYGFNHYEPLPTSNKFLDQIQEISYTNGQSISKTTTYNYSSNQDLDKIKSITVTDSKGDIYKTEYLYNYDYSISTSSPAYLGNTQFLLTTRNWKVNLGSSDELLSVQTNSAVKENGKIKFPSSFSTLANNTATSTDELTAITTNSASNQLLKTSENNVYDSKGNIVEVSFEEGKMFVSSLWDHRIGQKVADVSNAKYDEIAFTSFEGYGGYMPRDSVDENKGQWKFEPDNVGPPQSGPALSGINCYLLKPSGGTNYDIQSVHELETGKQYILTFWAKSPGVQVFRGLYAIGNLSGYQTTATGWTLYSAVITGDGTKISLKTPTLNIEVDEVRLHPFDASMTTYCHNPFTGVNTVVDSRNNVMYTERDFDLNKVITRDIDRNIISLTETTIQGGNN